VKLVYKEKIKGIITTRDIAMIAGKIKIIGLLDNLRNIQSNLLHQA
jgi:hypothetical protein